MICVYFISRISVKGDSSRTYSSRLRNDPDYSSRETWSIKTAEFIFDTDSNENGAVLSHAQNGEEGVVAFSSRTLNKHHFTFNKELLAIVTFIKQYTHFLWSENRQCLVGVALETRGFDGQMVICLLPVSGMIAILRNPVRIKYL